VAIRIYPHRGDAGGAKAVFREEFVVRWLAQIYGNAHHIRTIGVKCAMKGSGSGHGRSGIVFNAASTPPRPYGGCRVAPPAPAALRLPAL
jgi:hypothetical protein